MRLFEVLLLVMLAVSTASVAWRFRPPRGWAIGGGIAALVIFALHVVVEGVRWQMVPAYVMLAMTVVVIAWRALRKPADAKGASQRGGLRKIASGLVRLGLLPICFLIVAFLPLAFPVFALPEPPSWQQIGVTDLVIELEGRPETLTSDPDDHRELLVRAWYPAEVGLDAEPESYLTAAEARAVTEAMRVSAPVPIFLNDHLPLVRTHSHRDAPLSPGDERYPVLVFSHGYGSYVSQNTILMEHLASLGYVVFSIAHPHDGAVVFPGGRSIGPGEHFRAWAERSSKNMTQTFAELDRFAKSADPGERRAIFERWRQQAIEDGERGLGAGASWSIWVEDTRRFFDVLSELESGARSSIFEDRLDLDRVGLLGMSFGGAIAAEVCHSHPGCRGAINIDGGQYIAPESALLHQDISKPLLMIYASRYTTASHPSDANPGDFQAFNDFYYETDATRGLRRDVIRLRIDGASHIHLTDAVLMMRYLPGLASGTPGERIHEILNRYCRAFLDHHVKGADVRSPLLDGPVPEFPEVTYQTFGYGFDERLPPEAIPAPAERDRDEGVAPTREGDLPDGGHP